MRTIWLVGLTGAAALALACGDETSGEGTGGAGGQPTTIGTTKATSAQGGPGSTTTATATTTVTSTTGATTATTGSTTGAGGGAEHCADAISCSGVNGYFCYEKSGPDPAFEDECANELFGTYAAAPCDEMIYGDGACVFDCVEPSVYSFAIGVDQAACEMEGGTYYEHP